MHRKVLGYGPPNAKLAVIGEAPGAAEEREGFPFVGPSGNLLNECLENAGISRDRVYVTNVCKVRPPNNKIKDLNLIGYSLEQFIPELIDELNLLNPNCLLLVGNTALEALTKCNGIESYRGSILQSHNTKFKCVATLHPASLLHDGDGGNAAKWSDLALIKHDVSRAAQQSNFPEIILPRRHLEICRNSLQLIRFIEQYYQGQETIAFYDVETSKTIVNCVSLAFNKQHAISVPTLSDRLTDHELVYIWKTLAEFFQDTNIKLGAQNGKFDEKCLRQIGLKTHDLFFDTMLAWHALYCEFPKKLNVISSILTEEPYYKDEGKEYDARKHSFDRLQLYNAKDAAVEYECYEEEMQLLNDEPELKNFFFDKIMPLHRLYSDMEDVGLKVDELIRKNLHKKYSELRDEKYEKLINSIIDGDENLRDTFRKFNPNSPKQVANLLYGYLKCPVRKDTGESTLKSLANNAVKDQRKRDIIKGILEQRKIRKTIGTYLEFNCSSDDRVRTEMMICGTESGRTSTQVRRAPVVIMQEGLAFQTMTKHEDPTMNAGGADLRSMFVADEGYSFIEPDLSQAEDRVVCVLAKDWSALESYARTEFKRNKFGLKDDRHTTTAMMVCSLTFDEITDFYRQIGKKTRHAGNYNMGKHEGMLNMAKYGIFISEWKMGKYLEQFHAANPQIKQVFHAEIIQALADNNCILYSPHGRKRQFFNKWGDDLFKEAFAQIPQATISDQTKFALQRIYKNYSELRNKFFPVLESHDSFLALIRNDMINCCAKIVKHESEQPINFRKCTLSRDYDLVIPCEIKVGKRWIEKNEQFQDGMSKIII